MGNIRAFHVLGYRWYWEILRQDMTGNIPINVHMSVHVWSHLRTSGSPPLPSLQFPTTYPPPTPPLPPLVSTTFCHVAFPPASHTPQPQGSTQNTSRTHADNIRRAPAHSKCCPNKTKRRNVRIPFFSILYDRIEHIPWPQVTTRFN